MPTHIFCRVFGHKFDEWKSVASDSCEETRVCKRCQHQQVRTISHRWQEWKYTSSDSCTQMSVCDRCGESTSRVLHSWGEWQYVDAKTCRQTRECSRCGKSEHRISHLEGSSFSNDAYCTATKCKRCGHIEGTRHEFGSWESLGQDLAARRTCTKCGYKEYM